MATAVRDVRPGHAARAEVEAYFQAAQKKSLLRFITCGSVDDGKSTLIGRLLYDSKMLFEDQLSALAEESARVGTQGNALDFALLVDGLGSEREQGITIDVAYRFFATERRKFIVADTPGHEQYTRNMVTGASTADLAVILVDARKGILTQTRRHSHIVKLLGIRQLVLAVNKMDLVDFAEGRFGEIVEDYRRFAEEIGVEAFTPIPLSGLTGDNVTERSGAMPWYSGPVFLEHLETVPLARRARAAPFRMAVQWVNRPNSSFRGYSGRIASGSLCPGDRISVLPGGQSARVERIVTMNGDLHAAVAGQSVTLTLSDELDCSRGSLIVSSGSEPQLADMIEATLVWTGAEPLAPGRPYFLKIGTKSVTASIADIRTVIDVNSGKAEDGRPLAQNDIGRVVLTLDRPVPAIEYDASRELGAFILIDKLSNATVAAGMVDGSHARSAGASQNEHSEAILWIRGASRAERKASAARMRERYDALGRPVFVLDDDAVRNGLSSDLGGDQASVAEHVRRVREVAKLMSAAGVQVLVTIEAAESEAYPGRLVEASRPEEEGPGEWVI